MVFAERKYDEYFLQKEVEILGQYATDVDGK